MTELVKVETTISAIGSGNLNPDSWSHSHILALGLSGNRNPLGSAVLHLIEHGNEQNRMLVRFHLAGEIERKGICRARDAIDVAVMAIAYIEHPHCPDCGGRGVINFEQAMCTTCRGTGDRARPSDKATCDAIGILNDALIWLENQQRARLQGA